MYQVKTQELLPLIEEFRELKLRTEAKAQEVDLARSNFSHLHDEFETLQTQLSAINKLIDYCVVHDMDPVQAKLTLTQEDEHKGPQQSVYVHAGYASAKEAPKAGMLKRVFRALAE